MVSRERDVNNSENPGAVEEVQSGERRTANAAWWGFDAEDATEALQGAIDSGAERVIIPNMTRDWVVRPIELSSNQELVIEDGVVITAKRGEYRGKGETVLTARDAENVVIRGYGARIRMQKEDYIVGKVLVDLGWDRWFGPYEKAEWRTTLSLRGCSNVKICGLTLCDSGGDGIYIDGGSKLRFSRDIYLRDVVCDNNYRQGISIISVDGLLVENSTFSNTWGTPPSSGVDIEPDSSDQVIRNVIFRNCTFSDNYGEGIELFLTNMGPGSGEVSVLFENCRVTSSRGAGIRVSKVRDTGPEGLIEFRNCVVENTVGFGIKVQDKSADRARVRFVNCDLRNVALNRMYRGTWAPIWLHLFKTDQTSRFGGIDFVSVHVEDDRDRPIIVMEESESDLGLFDIRGKIMARNPKGVREELGSRREGVDIALQNVDGQGMD